MSSILPVFNILLIFFLSGLVLVQAQVTHQLDWTVPNNGGPLSPLTVTVGDTVIFNYGSDQPHDVWIHPNNQCEMQVDRIRVKGTSGPGVFLFEQPGSLFFCCDQGGHCENGLNIRITAVPAPTSPPVVAPTPAPMLLPTPAPNSVPAPPTGSGNSGGNSKPSGGGVDIGNGGDNSGGGNSGGSGGGNDDAVVFYADDDSGVSSFGGNGLLQIFFSAFAVVLVGEELLQ